MIVVLFMLSLMLMAVAVFLIIFFSSVTSSRCDMPSDSTSGNVELFRITITSDSTPSSVQAKPTRDLVYNDKTGMFE